MLSIRNISKTFGAVKALEGVSLDFMPGEVHAICGENGAGKSTLMNVIAGNVQPDSGTIYWKGEEVSVANVRKAKDLGISIVYQERSMVDTLSVSENIFPENYPLSKWGTIDYDKLYQQTQVLLDELQLNNISPREEVRRLSAAAKQMVEIAKALTRNPQLLILDEPTASITEKETQTLFHIIENLKSQGVSIIYISHRMAEIKRISDKVSILRDGRYQGTLEKEEIEENKIIAMMVGRELQERTYFSNVIDEVVLEVKNLSGPGFSEVNFNLKKGEILGFAGLVGSGRTELAKAIFGDNEIFSGEIVKNGKRVLFSHPEEAIANGIAYVPEERKALGLFLDFSIEENIIASKLNGLFYKPENNEEVAVKFQKLLDIKTPSVKQKVGKLSGGNQQKVVLAKWLNIYPDILIVDEPTHGVDVGAKREIYNILEKIAAEGKSLIIISSELSELLLLADRIAVMCQNKLSTVLERNQATEESIMKYATGNILSDQVLKEIE
jgi:ribose transport system ATP-binding protein